MRQPVQTMRGAPFGRATVLLATLVLFTATACKRGEEKDDEGKDAAEAPVTVAVGEVALGDIHDYIVTTSTLRAAHSADVSAQVSGLVEALEAEEGQAVRAGDVLARIDYRQLALAERKARAAHEKAQAAYVRARELEQRGLLAQEDLEAARFEATEAEITWKETDVGLQQATITAPIDGVIATREIRLGDRVSMGMKMFSIVDTSNLEADLHLPERYLSQLGVGQGCLLTTQSGDDETEHEGQVIRISPVVDAASGTVKCVVALAPTEDLSGPSLRPGQFVRARVITSTRQGVPLVPKKAVLYDEGRTLVFVLVDGKAREVAFRPGLSDGDAIEALDGIDAGATVLVSGHAALRDGAAVRTEAEALAARENEDEKDGERPSDA